MALKHFTIVFYLIFIIICLVHVGSIINNIFNPEFPEGRFYKERATYPRINHFLTQQIKIEVLLFNNQNIIIIYQQN